MAVIKRNKIAGKENSGNILSSLTERPTAAEFGEGELLILTPTYKIRCESNSASWTSHGSGPIADRPSATLFGVGTWQDGLNKSRCSGKYWDDKKSVGAIITDWHDGAISKLTSVSGESVALDPLVTIDGLSTLKCVIANGTFTAQILLILRYI
jgi:hypothetical protein